MDNRLDIVNDYNLYKGGVDLLNQMVSNYFSKHSHSKWTDKIIIYLIFVSIHNSYVLYKTQTEDNPIKTHID